MQMADVKDAVDMAVWEKPENGIVGKSGSSPALLRESELNHVRNEVVVRDPGDFLSITINKTRAISHETSSPEDPLCQRSEKETRFDVWRLLQPIPLARGQAETTQLSSMPKEW